ncbi:hypothetical protein H2248_008594 [Termitomyces sp. 'cryptogamus']|nr:hypothetical protein H2248_008594 [Termitomyces sp. 'cryptogamus']
MSGECQSTLPVECTVQHQDTFLSKASIKSLSHNLSAEENAAHAKNLVATGRQYWKTRGSQGEAIWPPHVEIALLEGLERYQKDTWKPIRDHRCPMRNKFISEHIEKTTGVFRTPRQISSRIQHLRDTCQAQSIVDLITPFKHEVTSTSPSRAPSNTPPSRPRNPYPRPLRSLRTSSLSPVRSVDSSSEEKDSPLVPKNHIMEPVPLRPLGFPPILTAPLSLLLPEANSSPELSGPETPQSQTNDRNFTPTPWQEAITNLQRGPRIRRSLALSYNIDVFLDNTASSVPLIPLAALSDLEPLQISLGPHTRALVNGSFSLDTVIQLVSPYPLLTQTVLSVFVGGCQTSIYTETTTLLCNSVPICGTDWFYMVSLPNFWNTLRDAADPGDYIIKQTIMPLCPEGRPLVTQNELDGTQEEFSEITICYRFCSTRPLLTPLHFDTRAYSLPQDPSVWQGTFTHHNLMSDVRLLW